MDERLGWIMDKIWLSNILMRLTIKENGVMNSSHSMLVVIGLNQVLFLSERWWLLAVLP
jgi:hypothetical protein